MSYIRPPGQGMTVTGPEVEETRRNGAVVGFSNVWKYEGTEAEIDAQRIIERSTGANRISKRPTGTGLYELTSAFPFDLEAGNTPETEEPQDLHELEVNTDQAPWQSSVVLNAILLALGGTAATVSAAIAAIHKAAENFKDGKYKPTATETTVTDLDKAATDLTTQLNKISSGIYTATGVSVMKRVLGGGIEGVITYNEVYRRSITAASYTQVQAAYEGSGKIWTNTEVETFEGIPTNEWFGLEANTQWLKSPPHVTAVARGKTQIQYYYTGFKRASRFFYEKYNAAVLLDV